MEVYEIGYSCNLVNCRLSIDYDLQSAVNPHV